MVDLVKIRKKKAKQKEEAEKAAADNVGGVVAPADAAASEPQPGIASAAPADQAGSEAEGAEPDSSEQAAEAAVASKLERFKSEAGKRREDESTRSTEVEQSGSLLELLTFVINGEQYAIDIEKIVEIVTPRAVTRIPNADPTIVGILSLRGTIVTLVDVRRKLRHATAPVETDDTRIIVIDFQNEIVGFVVDRVLRVVKSEAGGIEPHPVVHATELDDAIRGVFRSSGALTILLDLDKLLDHNSLAASN